MLVVILGRRGCVLKRERSRVIQVAKYVRLERILSDEFFRQCIVTQQLLIILWLVIPCMIIDLYNLIGIA